MMVFRLLRVVWVFFLVIFLQFIPALVIPAQVISAMAQDQRVRIVTHENSDYFGFDLRTERDVSLDQCKVICLQNSACAAFTYNQSAKFCFLKSDFGVLNPFEGAVAGQVVKSGTQTDIGAPPKLTFVPDKMYEEARKFRKDIASGEDYFEDKGFGALTKIARANIDSGDFDAAAENLKAALKIDLKHQPSWLELSDAMQVLRSANSGKAVIYQKAATSAALNGYFVSRTKLSRAAALARLARALEAQRQYRPALSAYEKSLELDNNRAERVEFLALREVHGFRVLDHTVDSESLNPRICVQFSEKLRKPPFGYSDFLTVDQSAPQAIDVKDKQICVEGLQHGKNYNLVVRQGLPSQVTEDLQADVSLNIYVQDREAAIRFTGSNFVLPSSGRHGLPLVTVNTQKANLKLFRIGERALAPLLRDSQFLQQLGAYQVEFLVEDLGEPVWEGSIDIKPELNSEVVTSIPIDEALPKREPGVYFMTAVPVHSGPDDYENHATQWFVISDLGLSTFSGAKHMRVFARSIASAKPVGGVDMTLIARNNEVLGTSRTNEQGEALFDAGLMRGKGGLAPAMVTAKNGALDFVFLDLSKAEFDFSDRGVTGREVAKGVDVYGWSERGIYRAGEIVHIAALARDASARAIENLPLTFVFTRPDGVEDRRIVNNGAALGGYNVQLPLSANAKRGTWQMRIYTDPKSEPVAEQRFLVEDFLPEKTDFTMVPVEAAIKVGQAMAVDIKGRYLYGAPAANLVLEGEVVVGTKRDRKGYEGYLFGLAVDDEGSTQRIVLEDLEPLNNEGESTFEILLNKIAVTTRPQNAQVVVRMREESGRAIERRVEVDVAAQDDMIGIKPQFDDGQIGENSLAGFEIIAVDAEGEKSELSDVRWSLVKIERNYQWYRSNSSWYYESVNSESRIADGSIDINDLNASTLSLPVEWGRYRLEVETALAEGPATSVEFNAGWYVDSQSTQTPDGLELALDKPAYKSGDIAKLQVSPRFAGELLIAIGTEHIVQTKTVTIPAEGSTVDIEVGDDWGAGAYVLATLYRPADADTSRNPKRAIGVKWLSVEPGERKLGVTLDVPAKTKTNDTLKIPVALSGLQPGEKAYVSVAAVDVGILNLTNYQSPDPVKRYFGQRKLGIAMRDIYGRLIDGSLGISGRLRTGGDGPDELNSDGSPPTEKLVAFFSGPVRVDDEGKAIVEFDLPQFNGSVRIMAVAWNKDGVGAAQAETIIRDPVVIIASMPRFLAPGDEARMLIEIANTDAPSGSFDIDYQFSANLKADDDALINTIALASGEKTSLGIAITAGIVGEGWVRIEISHANGSFASHEIALDIRSGVLPLTRKLKVPLVANSGSVSVDEALLAGNLLEGAKVNISVALADAIDVPSLLLRLNRYPFGCAEQVTSKALPLLYVDDFPNNLPGVSGDELREKIQKAINTVLSYQSNTGGFSLWGSENDDLWLGAYVTDFLTRAIEKGYDVPRQALQQSLQNLQNVLAYENNLEENDAAIAYSLYVLARNRLASAGDLRYNIDTQLESFQTPIARAQLAAAIALYGDQQRSQKAFDSAYELAKFTELPNYSTYSYGSGLRDAAAMLALATESRAEPKNIADMKQLVSTLSEEDTYTSTQEQAWMLLAARANKKSNEQISLNINGLPHSGAFSRQVDGADLLDKPLRVTNRNEQELEAIITTIAVPDEVPSAGGDGFSIERIYFTLDGSLANMGQVKQNERFVVVINFKQLNDLPSRIILTDLLPAGFEIDNPRLVKSADLKSFGWLPKTASVHSEFRSDRFVTAFNRSIGGQTDYTVAYTVRAVTPGTFTHPAAIVEDMYRPQFSARTSAGRIRVALP